MSPLVFQSLNHYTGFIMSLNILLVDRHPHVQQTLRYFLHHYSPIIKNSTSQVNIHAEEKKPDIIFIDSDQVKEKTFQPLLEQKTSDSPPVVLLSYSESFLKENLNNPLYHAQLKKPIEPQKLHQIVESLVPKTKDLKLSNHLKFYDITEPPKETSLSPDEPPKPRPLIYSEKVFYQKKKTPALVFLIPFQRG